MAINVITPSYSYPKHQLVPNGLRFSPNKTQLNFGIIEYGRVDVVALNVNQTVAGATTPVTSDVTASYRHNQPTPALVWLIKHDLNGSQNGTAYDLNGIEIEGVFVNIDNNNMEFRLGIPAAGYAIIGE